MKETNENIKEKLDIHRLEIDKIDGEIVELLVKRMNTSAQIGKIKKENNIEVLDSSREDTVIKNVLIKIENIDYKKYIVDIFKNIIKNSKEIQMTKKLDVKAVIFDMDGLMFDTEILSSKCLVKAAADYGVEMTIEETFPALGKTWEDTYTLFEEYYSDNPKIDGRQMVKNAQKYIDETLYTVGPDKKPYIEELLVFLRDNDYKVAVASSSNISDIDNNITRTDLKKYFDIIASGQEVENGKPHPDVFLLAAERLGVEPEKCLVLEDSRNGILGAVRANMKSIIIPDLYEPDSEVLDMVDFAVKDLGEVIKILNKRGN